MATKLLDLAIAQCKKTDGDKAIDKVKSEVRIAENSWRNEVFEAENAVEKAKARVDSLESMTTASGSECLAASREFALAEKNLADLKALQAARF